MTQAASPHAGPLASQVALVTGASSGLGCATALALARAGADIGLLARSEPDLQKVAAEIAAIGRRALPLPVDLADAEQIAVAVGRTVETFGREVFAPALGQAGA